MARVDRVLDNVFVTGKQYCKRDIGSQPVATAVAEELGGGCFMHQSVLTLSSMVVSVVGATGVGFGYTKIYDFSAGVIDVLGVTVDITFDTTGTNLDAADGGDYSLGTTGTADVTLDGTDVNLFAKTGVDPLSDGSTGYLAAGAKFDGTSSAIDVIFNMLIDDADIGATESLLVNGTIIITWFNEGDY